jgi:hypothetical protein
MTALLIANFAQEHSTSAPDVYVDANVSQNIRKRQEAIPKSVFAAEGGGG